MSNLKLAIRSMFRERGVTIVALSFFAIGIAANSTIFSLVQAVEFPRLMYPEPYRIVFLESRNTIRNLNGMPVSSSDASDVAAASHSLELPSLTADQSSILREVEPARRIGGRQVTHTFFEVMRVPPALGRTVSASDGPEALVMSSQLWRSAFGADPKVVGRAIRLDGGTVTVIGVMPDRFDEDADFWVGWKGAPATAPRDDRQYTLFARLANGVSTDAAKREITDISARLAAEHPATNTGWVTEPIPLPRLHGRDSHGTFLLLQGAVGFVLLIACANISNLLLARGTRRRHEMAVRLTLGASRRQLLGQLLTESVLLALVGGAIGVILSLWGVRLANSIGGFPPEIRPSVNLLVLLFTAVVAMLTGIVSGILPALRMSRVPPEAVLRTEGGRSATQSGGGLRTTLVAIQVASAIALATGGALMLQTLAHRLDVDLGFNPESAVRADLSLQGDRYRTPEGTLAAVDRILTQLQAQNEVQSAGMVTWALPTAAGGQRTFSAPAQGTSASPGVQAITPGYFEAMQIPSRVGRGFTEGDRAGTTPVAVVNEELARQLWPGRSPVGEFLRLGPLNESAPMVAVVGVVGTIRRSPMHTSPVGRVYLPFAQYPNATMQVIVRGRQGTSTLPLALSQSLHEVDATLFAEELRTLSEDAAQFVAPIRLITFLLALFAALGLLLAALGVFGTMTYNVSQRARELAIRSALGASRRDLTRMVIGKGLIVTMAGVVPGIGIALLSSRALGTFLYGVSATDPWTLAGVVGVLIVVSLIASYRPAAMAASVDPMKILRRD
ncbi:MAG TPA: ABC transporter permease [Vicinamibacterales bacterium]|nr:ABC transporter permease [Vicinamibacterales bacterium]